MNNWNKSYDECGVYSCADDYDAAQKLKAERTRLAHNKARRERDQIRRDCGPVPGRDSLGRVIWE